MRLEEKNGQFDLHSSDGNRKFINSRMILQAKQTSVGYSFWSLMAMGRSSRNSSSDAAALLTMEMIREHEQENIR